MIGFYTSVMTASSTKSGW